MKRFVTFTLAAAATVAVATKTKDTLSDLGLTSTQVKNTVFENIKTDYFQYPVTNKMREMARKIPAGSQGAAIKALGGVVKAYVESDEFRSRYNEYVEETYRVDGATTEEEITALGETQNQMLDTQAESTNVALAALDQIPDNMVPMMLQSFIQQRESEMLSLQGEKREARKKEVAELKKLTPNATSKPAETRQAIKAVLSKDIKADVEKHRAQAEEEREQMKGNLEHNQKQLALQQANKDYNKILKERLKAFLDLSASVDFDAKLQKSGSKWYFVNSAYEQKSEDWKFLYRLGKEPVTAARTFAADWLKELNAKAK